MATISANSKGLAVSIATYLISGMYDFSFEAKDYCIILPYATKETVANYLLLKGFSESDFEVE